MSIIVKKNPRSDAELLKKEYIRIKNKKKKDSDDENL